MLVPTLRKLAEQDHLRIKEGQYANRIMQGLLTLHEYKILIIANYYFHSTIQKDIEHFFIPFPQYQFKKRDKVDSLQKDLVELDLSFEQYKFDSQFKIESFWEALGAAYVIEGTAIGGAIIRKKLLTNKNIINHINSINFFGCYHKDLSPLWKSFINFLEEQGQNITPQQIEETVEKAKATFLFYEDVIEESKKHLEIIELEF